MAGKRPSSLDYEAYVDELAVSSFRRALTAERFDKARASLERLLASPERMWRWVGLRNLAVLALARGLRSDALRALDEAERLYPDVPGLVSTCRAARLDLLLDSGDVAAALALARAQGDTVRAALALVRLGRASQARRSLESLTADDSGIAAYLRWEIESGDSRALRAIVEDDANRARYHPLRFRLGGVLEAEGRRDEAAEVYASLQASDEALFDHPVCFVRSAFRLGLVESGRGRLAEARSAFVRFLTFWQEGELDRNEVEEAAARLSG